MLKKVEKKYDNGTIICTVDENGVEQGPCEIHLDDGTVGKGTYKDGKLDGLLERYYPDGSLKSKTNWVDGKCEGLQLMYHPDGSLEEKRNWVDGKREGLDLEYYPDGTLRAKANWVDGKKEGVGLVYHPNGNIFAIVNWQNDFKEGPAEYYHPDGRLQGKISWYRDSWDGPCEFYDEPEKSGVYRKGEKLEGKEAEAYLQEWKQRPEVRKISSMIEMVKADEKRHAEEAHRREVIGGLKGKLEILTDPNFRKPVEPARTLERQQKAQEIVDMRRARAVFKDAVEKAQEEGDDQTLQEIVKLAKPFEKPWMEVQSRIHKRGVARRAARAKKDRG